MSRGAGGALLTLAVAAAAAGPAFGAGTVVTIADTGTTASQLGADLSARALTARGFTVTRVSQPSAAAADTAVRAGTLDAYVTDSATLQTRVYIGPVQRDDAALRAALVAGAQARAETILGITPADDAPTVACTKRAVKAFGITGLLKLRKVAGSISYGATASHMVRADGYFALGAIFQRVIVQPASGRFGLFASRKIQCVLSSAAEPRAAKLGLTTLRDTTRRLAGTPRHTVTVVANGYLAGAPPEFAQTVEGVAALVNTGALTGLRGAVELNGATSAAAAEGFLRANKVIQ